MTQSRVAVRYAQALLDLANEKNATEQVYNDMVLLKNALNQSQELTHLMNNPVVGAEQKSSIFSAIFKDKMSPMSFGFIDLVLKKRRESDFGAIAQSFIDLYQKQQGITHVTVTTAIELDQKALDEIVDKLKKQQHLNEVELETIVDPSIIGGFIAEFDNQILDQSIETNLNQIKRRLTSVV